MTDAATNSVQLTRDFGVAPEQLFEAWVDPAKTSQWLFTMPESESNNHELDVRVGGSYTITDRRAGEEYMGTGEYLEVAPPSRLVFTFGMPQFSEEFDRITVEIAPSETGSTLTLTQEGMPDGYQDATIAGWEKMFDSLATTLK